MYIHHLGHNSHPCIHIIGTIQKLARKSSITKKFDQRTRGLRCNHVVPCSRKPSWVRVSLCLKSRHWLKDTRLQIIWPQIRVSLTKVNQLTFWSTFNQEWRLFVK